MAKKIELFTETIAYPNPTNGIVFIKLKSLKPTVLTEVYNSNSILIYSKEIEIKNGKISIDLSKQPIGIYFIKLNTVKPKFFKLIKS